MSIKYSLISLNLSTGDAIIFFCKYVYSREDVWAGQDVIASAADYLGKEIHIYMAADKIFPLIYSPSSQISYKSPLRIVYFEPGHFRSVGSKCQGKIGEYNNSCSRFELLDIRRTNQQHVIDNNESQKKGN